MRSQTLFIPKSIGWPSIIQVKNLTRRSKHRTKFSNKGEYSLKISTRSEALRLPTYTATPLLDAAKRETLLASPPTEKPGAELQNQQRQKHQQRQHRQNSRLQKPQRAAKATAPEDSPASTEPAGIRRIRRAEIQGTVDHPFCRFPRRTRHRRSRQKQASEHDQALMPDSGKERTATMLIGNGNFPGFELA